ncbi:sodium-coupled neutral amino acid transporter 7-like isoform X2 [Halichondria panicea]|uniref:sodium-coupled neutral amino acid transporter 7-like isoform X2 n=1 Tax=Halichondria panicea TaxID=6063 RepID=UPI00312BA286
MASLDDKLESSNMGDNTEAVAENPGIFAKLSKAWRVATQGTVVSSIFILLTTSVGAGTLSLPYGFAQGGLVFSSIIFFVIMLISIHVGSMLFAGKRYAEEVYPDREVWGYADLAEVAYGTIGKIAVLLTIAVLLFLSLIAYMIFARDQLEAIVSYVLVATNNIPACSPLLNCALLMCMAFLPVFPITLLRNLSPLQFTSYLSATCVFFVATAMSIDTGIYWTSSDFNASIADHSIQLAPVGVNGSLTVISYCSLAFICHFNLLPLQKELKGPVTKVKLYSIIVGAILTAYVLYNIVIFAGYFRFFESLKSDVMVNYPKNNHLMLAARVALLFMLVTSYPVLLHPTRDSINSVIILIKDLVSNKLKKRRARKNNVNTEAITLLDDVDSKIPKGSNKNKIPTLIWFCETWIIFALTFLPASFITDVSLVWNFVGSIGGVLVLYIYPAACYLKLRFARNRLRSELGNITIRSQYNSAAVVKELVAWTILIIGLLLLVVENYQAISQAVIITSGSKEPSGLCFQLDCKVVEEWNHTYWGLYS